ncbi:MAG: Rieske 2Fe-2S domain-containing protein [Acidobacteriota bacterium]|nr:Rieske 2Fe-2S domain-containing protein [Acidobacteriota bacterium]
MPSQDAPTPPRRTFLDALLGLGFATSFMSVLYPVWRYVIPPASAEPATDSMIAGKITEFKPNTGAVLKFGTKPALLVRTSDGQFKAFSAVCTHLDCTVQFKADTSQIWCPCHNGFYDLSGAVVSGPPPRPLEGFQVNLRGEPGQEDVVISRT